MLIDNLNQPFEIDHSHSSLLGACGLSKENFMLGVANPMAKATHAIFTAKGVKISHGVEQVLNAAKEVIGDFTPFTKKEAILAAVFFHFGQSLTTSKYEMEKLNPMHALMELMSKSISRKGDDDDEGFDEFLREALGGMTE